ncbi:hypothetical protein SALWKB12_1938 [Snodgrassella communis]|uniref:Uncharacterized protein n=1 Tax=Snodgrassella communis TaxID=2946699 RepID=A0A836MPQ1_9NEIS|nr:hypothetical protein SALWKB12_1938 [Snodgrassella communis]KDN14249.1 hypothetical protein SALWKB29_1739 [Snodgrassella communis]
MTDNGFDGEKGHRLVQGNLQLILVLSVWVQVNTAVWAIVER